MKVHKSVTVKPLKKSGLLGSIFTWFEAVSSEEFLHQQIPHVAVEINILIKIITKFIGSLACCFCTAAAVYGEALCQWVCMPCSPGLAMVDTTF